MAFFLGVYFKITLYSCVNKDEFKEYAYGDIK